LIEDSETICGRLDVVAGFVSLRLVGGSLTPEEMLDGIEEIAPRLP